MEISSKNGQHTPINEKYACYIQVTKTLQPLQQRTQQEITVNLHTQNKIPLQPNVFLTAIHWLLVINA